MIEIAKAHLEGVYKEYNDYKEYYKSIYKSPEERKRQITDKLTAETEQEEIVDLVFTYNYKYNRHEADLYNLLTRLYHTVKAYQDIIEIPEELLKEVEPYKMLQAYTFIGGEIKQINKNEDEEIKTFLKQNFDQILNQFKQPTL